MHCANRWDIIVSHYSHKLRMGIVVLHLLSRLGLTGNRQQEYILHRPLRRQNTSIKDITTKHFKKEIQVLSLQVGHFVTGLPSRVQEEGLAPETHCLPTMEREGELMLLIAGRLLIVTGNNHLLIL